MGALVSGSISLPFRGSFRLSLTVLVHYRWQSVFSLRRWSSWIPARFLVSRGTWGLARRVSAPPTGLSPALVGRSRPLRNNTHTYHDAAPQPRTGEPVRFRLLPVRSPLLGESFLLSFPPGTKMFQFPGCPPHRLCVHRRVTTHYSRRVSPFGFRKINALVQLPCAFRRLSRPSSALCPKASTRRPV